MVISKFQAAAFLILILSIIGTTYFTREIKINNDTKGLVASGVPSIPGRYHISQEGECIGSAEVAIVREDNTAYSLIITLTSGEVLDLKAFFNAAGQLFRSELSFEDITFTTKGVAPIDVAKSESEKFFVQGVIEFREKETTYDVHYIPRELKVIKVPQIVFPDGLTELSFTESKECDSDYSTDPEWIKKIKRLK